MMPGSKSPWSERRLPPVDLALLERDLRHLSVRYMKQSVELPLNHQDQAVMSKLYAAVKVLQQAVGKGAAADAIFEIGSNLIGCEQVALLVTSEQQDQVAFIGSAGFDPEKLEALRRNAMRIIEENPTDSIYIQTGAEDRCFLSSLGITARIRFRLNREMTGAIVLFDLLPQRSGLDSGDRELLKLLGTFAGPCLAAGKIQHHEILG
jgi:hypothetical protein